MASARKTRMIQMLALGGVLLIGSAVLVGTAFRDTIVFFFSPTEMIAQPRSPEQLLRLGGLVQDGSLVRGQGETISFTVTDGSNALPVSYTGVLPDLFREGQGVVAEGYLRDGHFTAVEVLAKHDENYIPKEVADALKAQGHWEGDKPKPGASASGS